MKELTFIYVALNPLISPEIEWVFLINFSKETGGKDGT